jgi:hypothetical protein
MPQNLRLTRRRILILLLVVLVSILTIGINHFLHGGPEDPFLVKYRQVRKGMTYEAVVQVLGPPDWELHPGGSFGDHYYSWRGDGGREIEVQWDIFGEYNGKRLLPDYGPWWKRFLSRIGILKP